MGRFGIGIVVILAAAGCGGSASSLPSDMQPPSNAKTAPVVNEDAAKPFSNPDQLVKKARAGGFDCHFDSSGDHPAFDMNGAIAVECWHGPLEEGVRFEVYPTDQSQQNAAQNTVGQSSWGAVYFSHGWGVFAHTQATVDRVAAIIDR